MINNTTNKNPRTEGRKKFITSLCCHVGRNNKTWIETLSLDSNCCNRTYNVWYYLVVKSICWECIFDSEPSWLCSSLLKSCLKEEIIFWWLEIRIVSHCENLSFKSFHMAKTLSIQMMLCIMDGETTLNIQETTNILTLPCWKQ